MSPYQYPDTPEATLAQAHRQVCLVSVTHPYFGVVDVDLSHKRGDQLDIDYSETRAPRVAARLSCPLIPGLILDPRTGPRLTVSAGYAVPGGAEDIAELVDLGIRNVSTDWSGGKLQVSATSDEALAVDASPAVSASVTGATTATAIRELLNATLDPAPDFYATADGPAVTVDPIEDRWSAAQDLADRIGAQLYDDGLRYWRLSPTPDAVAAEPHHTLRIGSDGTVLEPVQEVTRDDWSNYVQLVYRWRTPSGADAKVIGTAYAASGPYRITGPAGRRILKDERSVATTQAEANNAAAAVLARQLSRAEQLTIRAIAAYWLRPGHTVRVYLPDGQVLDQLVSSVSFQPLQGLMTVTTRKPFPRLLEPDPEPDEPDTPDAPAPAPKPGTSTGTVTPPAQPPKPDPRPPAKVRYSTEWAANVTAVYRGNGTKRADVDAGDVWQGTFGGSYNGNQRSLALFTAANSVATPGKRGEAGKTVSQALSGVPASAVERVELIAYAEHWWSNSGGTALFGYYAGTAAPASNLSCRPYRTVSSWTVKGWRTVNLTDAAFVSALVKGISRGVTLGPGSSTSTLYYGRLSGLRLRITYAK